MDKKPLEKEKKIIKVWDDSEVQLLKKWGEVGSSYRLLHDRAFREYQYKSYSLAIPVIIMSTLSGTASFSISSFPVSFQHYVPMVIGGINIFVGIVQTVAQFLRVNELTESHRVASITYGKFARNITTELSLPPNDRTYNGIDFVQMCRTEMDRLIEQSPIIPMHLLNAFENNPDYDTITKPDVLTICNIVEYQPSKEEKVAIMIANVADKIEYLHDNEKKTNVQKIQDKFEKNINPQKYDNIVPNEVKDIISSISFTDIEKGNIDINNLTNNIINKRNEELSEIGQNGLVSKFLKKNNEGNLSTPIIPILQQPPKKGLDLNKLMNLTQQRNDINLNLNKDIFDIKIDMNDIESGVIKIE